MPAFIQASFAKGEVTPRLYGRVDTSAYQIGLRLARNVFVHASGGISNRTGNRFIGPVRDHTNQPRLIKFEFKTTDSYILVFEDMTMRVVRDDQFVTDTSTAITGATAANPCVVTSVAHGLTTGDDVNIFGVVGMTRLNERIFRVTVLTADTFSLRDQVTGTAIDSSAFAAWVSGGTVERIYTKDSPYAVADLGIITFTQSADVMTLTHASYPIYELGRSAHNVWNFNVPTFAPVIGEPSALTVTPNTTGSETQRYKVTAVDDQGRESLSSLNTTPATVSGVTAANPAVVTATGHGFINGDEVQLDAIVGMVELNGRRFTALVLTSDTFQLEGEDSTAYTAYVSGGTATQTFTRITNGASPTDNTMAWSASAGPNVVKYIIYRELNGLFGLVGESNTLTFDDKNIGPDTSSSPPVARNPFFIASHYPGAVGYFEQRRVFGGSNNNPDTSVYSRTADQSNFAISDPGQSDDAITATLTSREVNVIRHFVPRRDMLVFTAGEEWRVNNGTATSFEASTIVQQPQSNWGCSFRAPIVIGNTVLFLTENGCMVRSLTYSWSIDGYQGNEITVTAEHLTQDFIITDWIFARIPDPVIFAVREDGQLLTLTFNEEQQMVAWTHHDTLGKFEAVSMLHHPLGEVDDAAYFAVKRSINGSTVRYIERTASRRFTDVRDCFFVDAGLTYDNPVTITGITAASPIVVTAPAHGFSNGDPVDLFDIVWQPQFDDLDNESQPDQLNTRRYYVINKATDTFQISLTSGGVAVNASDFADGFVPYVEGGTARKAVQTISALDQLEGQAVSVLADGNVVPNMVVTNGAIVLPRKASRVQVGLKYVSDIETLNIEAPQGTIQGLLKKIAQIIIRFDRSRGLLYGLGWTDLVEMKQREDEAMGDPTTLLTGDKELGPSGGWDTNGRVCLRQRDPLPMTILDIIPKYVNVEQGNDQ